MTIDGITSRFPTLTVSGSHYHGGLWHTHDHDRPHDHEIVVDNEPFHPGSYQGYLDGPGVRFSIRSNGELWRLPSAGGKATYERFTVKDRMTRRASA